MDGDQIQEILSYAMKTLFVVLGVLILISIVSIEANKKPPEEIASIVEGQKEMMRVLAKTGRVNGDSSKAWPAQMNKVYPEIELFDQNGAEFLFSGLKGRVVILEFIDMSSPISQAQSGAMITGAYKGASMSQDVDKQAQPFSDVLRNNTDADVKFPNGNIMELKIIIYGEGGRQATRDDAQNWAAHFNLTLDNNVIVAVPKKDMRGKESASLIGGFQLIDANLLLRVDSAGVMPKHNLKMTLVPLVLKLIR